MIHLLASIPSPPDNTIGIGPLEVRAYGVAIAVGVVVAVWLAQRRWAARGGDPGDITSLATWAVPAGLVGARLYHVITDWHRFEGRWLEALAIWQGGLGIPGGLLAGVVTGTVIARRRRMPVAQLLDTVAPAIPVAQAIGRLGNWFNQELYGRASGLPWALRIDPEHRPDGSPDVATYHPTFLYEALWNLGLAGLIIAVGRRFRLRPGQLFVIYVAGYAGGRLLVESLRIDPATEVLGLRVNIVVSAVVMIAALAVLAARARRPDPTDPPSREVHGSPTEPRATVPETLSSTGHSGAEADGVG